MAEAGDEAVAEAVDEVGIILRVTAPCRLVLIFLHQCLKIHGRRSSQDSGSQRNADPCKLAA